MKNYTLIDDNSLVLLAKEDKEAFGELYERYVTRVYSYVYYRAGNHQDAEDLTAKVFMRAMGHIQAYDERGVPFSAWLYRIAHNLVANWHRDRNRHKIIPLEEFTGWGDQTELPEETVEINEDREHLWESFQRLPEERQQLLILKYVERLSNAEIGVIMNRTEGAVKSLYYRTLSFLRDDLGGESEMQDQRREME